MGFEFTSDTKVYAYQAAKQLKKIVVGGITLFVLTCSPMATHASGLFKYDLPTNLYERVDAEARTIGLTNDIAVSVLDTPDLLAGIKHGELMGRDERMLAMSIVNAYQILPVERQFAQFNSASGALFVSMLLPEQLMVCATSYIGDADNDVYFSVKGNGQLLFSGSLPLDAFIARTLEAVADVQARANA